MTLKSKDLLEPPVAWKVMVVFVVCTICALIAIIMSTMLARRHINKGKEVSGDGLPIRRSMHIAAAIMAVPVFALISVINLLTPESRLLWSFVLSLIMASVMFRMPTIYIDAIGGASKLAEALRNYAGEPLKLFGNPPLCCFFWEKPKMPEIDDIRKLKLGVMQFCLIQPVLTLLELFICLETLNHVADIDTSLAWRKPVVQGIKIISNLMAMSSCTGLATLCEMADPNDNVEEGMLRGKKGFAQSFLWGMGLIPNILSGFLAYCLHDIELSNGKVMKPQDQTIWAVSAGICIASLYMTSAAYKAFPENDPTMYPDGGNYEPLL